MIISFTQQSIRIMSKRTDFYPVKVKAIEKTTPDCSIISLDIPGDLSDLFAYKQGQYLTLKAEINGEEVRRSYSLCSSPIDQEWKIGVKKIEGGRFRPSPMRCSNLACKSMSCLPTVAFS